MKYNETLENLLQRLGLTVISSKHKEIYAICPWHNDKTPSLHINKEKMVYLCRAGCTKGTVAKLITQLAGDSATLNYSLAHYTKPTQTLDNNEFYDLPDYNYFNSLSSAKDNLYLRQRNIPMSFITEYDIRQTNNSILFPIYSDNKFLQHYKCSLTTLDKNNFCGYIERLTYTNKRNIRYMYSPGFHISRHFFPNLFSKSQYHGIILTEGLFDCLALRNAGFGQSFALLGTYLSLIKLKMILSLTRNVTLCLDNYLPGQVATQKIKEVLESKNVIVKCLLLPGQVKDVAELSTTQIQELVNRK